MAYEPSQSGSALDLDLPGLKLHHDIEMELPSWSKWDALYAELLSAGAEFSSARVSRRGGLVIARCRVTRIGSAAIKVFAGGMETAFGARLLSLEHLYLSTNDVSR